MEEKELETLIQDDRQHFYELLMAMGNFIDKSCGQLNKLYEKTTVLSMQMQAVTTEHVKHNYGPDLLITTAQNETVDGEAKSSVTKRTDRYKTDWMFTVSLDYTRREETPDWIYTQLSAKYAGVVIVQAVHDGVVINEYRLSGAFVARLFSRQIVDKGAPMKRKYVFNLGTTRCPHHNSYHRLDKYVRYDTLMTREGTTPFTNEQWRDILARERPCNGVY